MDKVKEGKVETVTSIKLFRKFLERNHDGTLNASKVISTACYQTWLETRTAPRKHSPESLLAFRRALAAHVTGSDGRVPFEKEEEEAVLRTLRVKESWPCFAEAGLKEGQVGFRAAGFHEKKYKTKMDGKESKKRGASDETSDRKEQRMDTRSLQSTASGEVKAWHPPSETRLDSKAGEVAVSSVRTGFKDQTRNSLWDKYVASYVPTSIDLRQSSANLVASWLVQGFLVLSQLGTDFSTQLFAMGRYAVFGYGILDGGITVEEAEAIVAAVSAEHPGDYVLAIDHAASDSRHRILAQNDVSITHFGHIASRYGGFLKMRTKFEDCPEMITQFAYAYFSRGQEFGAQARMQCQNGEYKLFEVRVFVDKTRRILIERGRLADSSRNVD